MSLFTTNSRTRRSFLKSSASVLALPFLESFASAQSVNRVAPKKAIFLGGGYGFTKQTFYPTSTGRFSQIGLTSGLAPLKEHMNDVTMVTNLVNKNVGNPHGGAVGYLGAGANRISCDQVMAQEMGKESRFSSLVLTAKESCSAQNAGHGHGSRSLSWNENGKPIAGFHHPLEVYHQIFSTNRQSRSELNNALKKKKSILDIVDINATSMNQKLSRDDREKLDEYFQGIREIELGLHRQAQWANVPKPKPTFEEPELSVLGEQEIKIMYDLMIIALQTDAARVISYRLPVSTLLTSMEISVSAHSISHYGFSVERRKASELRDQKCMELFGHFISRLKQAKDRDGRRLYDNCLVSYGTNLRSGHELKDLPALLSGGGFERIKHGSHIRLAEQTHIADYWLTFMKEAGLKIDKFHDSDGVIKQMYG